MRAAWMFMCVLCIAGICTASDNKDYRRYRIVRASPNSEEKLSSLNRYLQTKSAQGSVDVWKIPRDLNNDVTFTLHRHVLRDVGNWLRRKNIQYTIDRRDLHSIIKEAEERDKRSHLYRRSEITDGEIDLDVYNNHTDMNEFLETTAEDCSFCRIFNIGQSYEGRDMKLIKIGNFGNNKKAIFIDAGIHAREWIAPATALKLINNLVQGYQSGDDDAQYLIDNFVWFILPSVNPDGYYYSRTADRYWRKTRSPTSDPDCKGSDPNRNWSFHWDEVGTSPDPCSQIYPGPYNFSEVEARNLRGFLWQRKDFIQVYMSLHSYGQFWMYPWGFTSKLPLNAQDLDEVGQAAVDAIYEVDQKTYTLGSSTNVLYAAAGASDDWAKGVARMEYSYTVELRDEGDYGFLLPPDQIDPTFREFWQGVVAMAKTIKIKAQSESK